MKVKLLLFDANVLCAHYCSFKSNLKLCHKWPLTNYSSTECVCLVYPMQRDNINKHKSDFLYSFSTIHLSHIDIHVSQQHRTEQYFLSMILWLLWKFQTRSKSYIKRCQPLLRRLWLTRIIIIHNPTISQNFYLTIISSSHFVHNFVFLIARLHTISKTIWTTKHIHKIDPYRMERARVHSTSSRYFKLIKFSAYRCVLNVRCMCGCL